MGKLCGMISEEIETPYRLPEAYPRGRYLLAFDPLDGSSNIDLNMPVGTIFSILRAPEGCTDPVPEDFLQPGTRQVAAGYAIYGPASMLVLTLGHGVQGFTLDRDIGIYVLTHQDMWVPETASEFAVNASNQRFWEPPVTRYVEECVQGKAGPRGADFNMRWIATFVADVHRILLRGGLYMYPRDTKKSTEGWASASPLRGQSGRIPDGASRWRGLDRSAADSRHRAARNPSARTADHGFAPRSRAAGRVSRRLRPW